MRERRGQPQGTGRVSPCRRRLPGTPRVRFGPVATQPWGGTRLLFFDKRNTGCRLQQVGSRRSTGRAAGPDTVPLRNLGRSPGPSAALPGLPGRRVSIGKGYIGGQQIGSRGCPCGAPKFRARLPAAAMQSILCRWPRGPMRQGTGLAGAAHSVRGSACRQARFPGRIAPCRIHASPGPLSLLPVAEWGGLHVGGPAVQGEVHLVHRSLALSSSGS
jgi:hypothetical protein